MMDVMYITFTAADMVFKILTFLKTNHLKVTSSGKII